MKQKQIKIQTKTAKQPKAKGPPPKKVQKIIDEDDDEEEVVEKIVVAKKPVKKNAGKGKKVVEIVAPSEEEEEGEEDQVDDEALNDEADGEEASDEDNEEEVAVEEDDDQEDADEEVDDEENEAEDDDEENEAEDDDEENDAEDDDDEVEKDDGEVEEATLPSKVKTGIIPPSVPVTKIVVVSKLPNTCKKVDIVEAFAKYGAIDQIHMVTTVNGAFANIAFKTEKAAKAALAANKVLDSIISVRLKKERKEKKEQKEGKVVKKDKNSECVIFIRHIKSGTSEEDIKKHFESCGAIASVKVLNKFNLTYAFLTFKDKSSVPAAVKLHNSILNDQNISVLKNRNNYAKDESRYDKDLTIIVRNNELLQKLDVAKLETIFSKCGKINLIDILCSKNILAFVTFKNDKAVKNALKLNGKTEQGIKLDLDVYNPSNKKTGIYVHNLSKDCTEEDLRNVFSEAGEIAIMNLKRGYAVIRFKDTDGYCKSFLYNEVVIKGQHIFIEPLSTIKRSVLSKNNFKNINFNTKKPFKRPAPNGNSVFSAKKVKTN